MAALTSDGSGEIKTAAFGHQNLVAKHRQIGAAGDAVAHDRGELRDARGGNDGVVAKDPAEVVFVRKNLVLHRKKNAGGIDQINERQRAFEGDALRADKLLGGLGKKAPAFTVASLAMIMHGMPATLPMPATAPAAGTLPHCSYIL